MEIKKLKKSFFGGYNKKIIKQLLNDYENKLANKKDIEKQNENLIKEINFLKQENTKLNEVFVEKNNQQKDIINAFEKIKKENQFLKEKYNDILTKRDEKYEKKLSSLGNVYAIAYENAQKIIINAKEKSQTLLLKSSQILENRQKDIYIVENEIELIETEILNQVEKLENVLMQFKTLTQTLSSKKVNLQDCRDETTEVNKTIKMENNQLSSNFKKEIKEAKIDLESVFDDNNEKTTQLKIDTTKEDLEQYIKKSREKNGSKANVNIQSASEKLKKLIKRAELLQNNLKNREKNTQTNNLENLQENSVELNNVNNHLKENNE